MNQNSLDFSRVSPKEWGYMKTGLHTAAKHLLKDYIPIPEYKMPTEEEMSQTELNKMETLEKKKEVFSLFLKDRDQKIERITDEILRDKAINLNCKDIQDQSLQASTQALPGLIKEAYDAFSSSEGIDSGEAESYITLIGVVMAPNPLVNINNDDNRIFEFLKENGIDAYFWLKKGFNQEKKRNQKIDGKINYPRTKSRLKFFTIVAGLTWSEIESKMKNGTLHCRYKNWKEEIKFGIRTSVFDGIQLMRQNRSESQQGQVTKQSLSNSNMYDPD
jgi:hypothetical protein